MLFDLLDEAQISSYLNERENVVLDFYADWCPPCKKFMTTYDEVSRLPEYKHITFIKVNVDRFGELSGNYNITSIPTLILLNNKRALKKLVGYKEKEQFVVELNNYYINTTKTKVKTKKPTKQVEPTAVADEKVLTDSKEIKTEVATENVESVNNTKAEVGNIDVTGVTNENTEVADQDSDDTNTEHDTTTVEGNNDTEENT